MLPRSLEERGRGGGSQGGLGKLIYFPMMMPPFVCPRHRPAIKEPRGGAVLGRKVLGTGAGSALGAEWAYSPRPCVGEA